MHTKRHYKFPFCLKKKKKLKKYMTTHAMAQSLDLILVIMVLHLESNT